jgi:hypothetical protein
MYASGYCMEAKVNEPQFFFSDPIVTHYSGSCAELAAAYEPYGTTTQESDCDAEWSTTRQDLHPVCLPCATRNMVMYTFACISFLSFSSSLLLSRSPRLEPLRSRGQAVFHFSIVLTALIYLH